MSESDIEQGVQRLREVNAAMDQSRLDQRGAAVAMIWLIDRALALGLPLPSWHIAPPRAGQIPEVAGMLPAFDSEESRWQLRRWIAALDGELDIVDSTETSARWAYYRDEVYAPVVLTTADH